MSKHVESLELRRLLSSGSIDPAFNNEQIVQTPIAGGSSVATDAKVLPDGSILAVGVLNKRKNNHSINETELIVVKYNFDGSLDTTFGANGEIVATPRGLKNPSTIQLTSDGGFIVGGSTPSVTYTPYILVKFTALGKVDTAFGSNGAIRFSSDQHVHSVSIDPNGKIVVADDQTGPNQTREAAIFRYTARGKLDTSFNGGSFVVLPPKGSSGTIATFNSIAFDPQHRMLASVDLQGDNGVTNTQFIYRVTDDGKIDRTFGTNGKVQTDINGRIAGVFLGGGIAIVSVDALEELNRDGTPDTIFAPGGKATGLLPGQNPHDTQTHPGGDSVALMPDGSVFFGNRAGGFAITGISVGEHGALNANFGGTASFEQSDSSAVNGLTLAPDRSLVAVGTVGTLSPTGKTDTRTFTVARVLTNTGPTVQLVPRTLRKPSRYLTFDLLIRDPDGINLSSLDDNDLHLLSSNQLTGYKVHFAGVNQIDGNQYVVATYRALAPNQSAWTSADNDSYIVDLRAKNGINGGTGGSAGGLVLGTVRVKIA